MLEFFVTTHGARKGLADTALRTADAGYLTRRLVDVAQDVIIRANDCETTEGILACRLTFEGKVIETMGDRAAGRISLATLKKLGGKETIIEFDDLITEAQGKELDLIENAFVAEIEGTTTDEEQEKIFDKYRALGFEIDDHGRLGAKTRSPISCELEMGICAKCYGLDLASHKLVEEGVAVGIIAAQSIGEPGTQLTMRTFHTGGVAGSKTIARTNQYKTGKFVRQFQEDFQAATQTESSAFDPTKLLESQESVVKGLFQAKAEGAEDETPAKKPRRTTKALEKAAEKLQGESRKLWERSRKTFFYSWTGESSGIVRVEEIFEARKQPRGKAIICPVTGIVADIQRSSYGRWIVVEAEIEVVGALKDAYIADVQNWAGKGKTKKDGDVDSSALERLIGTKMNTAAVTILKKNNVERVRVFYPILVPPLGNLPVQKGAKIIKGDPLTEGPLDPHEVLELAGAKAVHEYFIENLQSVYKDQGVDINDKHLEVIVRQMLRKRQIKEPGNTPFLPGQIVDRFRFVRENERVQQMIASGKKFKVTNPETGEEEERDPKEATGNWILLGITEASLATDSFLSAASFQKTTRVLTEAAVRGKHDGLLGLKENVIIGRLIPAGTGVKPYREIAIDVDRTQPSWAQQSLTALVEADESETPIETEAFGNMSLADLAAEDVHPADE